MALSIPGGLNEESPVLFVDFNQDFTTLCVGTRSGYSLFSTENNQFVETFTVNGDPMCFVGRLFSSNLVTLVSLNNLRHLLIFHYNRNRLICNNRYTSTIVAIKMNRKRMIVCLEHEIFIHDISDVEILHRIEDTPSNKSGVLAFSTCPDKCYLAYPGSSHGGTVFIFDAINFTNVLSIAAHDGHLAALSFNASSTMLATASERGTVLRVFSIPDGNKLMEFRRGLARCACICSLNFSSDDRFLVTASNTETVHIFKLEDSSHARSDECGDTSSGGSDCGGASDRAQLPSSAPSADQSEGGGAASTWGGSLVSWVGGVLKAGAGYLPHQVSEVFSQDRSFAYARILTPGTGGFDGVGDTAASSPDTTAALAGPQLPGAMSVGFKKVAALTSHLDQYRLLVAGLDGFLHIFSVDPLRGGETTLIQTENLLAPSVTQTSVPTGGPVGGGGGAAGTAQSKRTFAAAVIGGDENLSGQDIVATELFNTEATAPIPPRYKKDFPAIPRTNSGGGGGSSTKNR